MKLWETFRYELTYQLRSYTTWFYFVLLLALSYLMAAEVFIDEPMYGNFFMNAPYIVARVGLISFFFIGLLVLAPFAGNAAARDVETRMHSLLFSAPVSKFIYLGGRFLAAFAVGAIIITAIPLGIMVTSFVPMSHPELVGPFKPLGYINAYFFLLLPNTFIAIALMFAVSLPSKRGIISYLIAILICFAVLFSWQFIGEAEKNWALAKLTDPLGITITQNLSKVWTPAQKNSLMPGMETTTLLNRLIWISIALGVLSLTYLRFKMTSIAQVNKKDLRRNRKSESIASFDDQAKNCPCRYTGSKTIF